MEKNNLSKSNKIKIIVLTALVLLAAIGGITYAYFGIQITGNDTASSMRLTTATMSLIYNDVQILSDQSVTPGWTSNPKTLTVYNDGDQTVYYNLIWRDLLNEVLNGELTLSATCSSDKSGNTCPSIDKAIPTKETLANNVSVRNNIKIEPGETHTYTVTISFIETGSNQNYNQGKSFSGTLNISEGAEYHPLYNVVKTLAQQGTYASTYSGNDTNDTYGTPGTKTVYYIKTSTANNATQASTILNSDTDIVSGSGIRGINVKFAGYCWQILRTTDTGGIKLIYNGEFTEGTGCKAQNTTDTHKGVIGASGTSGDMTGNYMYSDTFTYNTSTNQFILVNPVVKNWSNSSDKEYILGKYTCKNGNTPSTCTTLYYVNTPHRTFANNAYYTSYTIGDTQHAQIGTSPFNANYKSPAYVGYMFGDTAYEYVGSTAPTSGSIMGNDVYWNGNNYELQETGTEYNDTHHYTCNTTSSTCTDGKVRYYYYNNYYIELTGGDKIEDAISKMITNSTNTRDSAMKSYLENWYYNNIYGTDAEDYIDQDAVYCNDRSINNLGGWSKDGSKSTALHFKNYNTVTTLGCTNNVDKFSVSNSNAALKYPIGLATAPEMNLINNDNIRKTGQDFWLVSPRYFGSSNADGRSVSSGGSLSGGNVRNTYGGRPVITLKPSRETITGNGSLSNPYVIGENN